jgi:hypothetical protein
MFTPKHPELWRHVDDDDVMSLHFSLPASLAKKFAEQDQSELPKDDSTDPNASEGSSS